MGRLAETAIAAALFLAISLASAFTQRAERVFGDGEQYHRMSWQFADGVLPLRAEAPFVYRLATPWLAARVDPLVSRVVPAWIARAVEDSAGLKGVVPFYAVNIAATLGALVLLLAYLRCFVASPALRLLLVALWMAAWHAPARYVYFNPTNVEPLFFVAVLAGLLTIEKTQHLNAWRRALLMAPLVVVATLCRESGVLVSLVFVAGSRPLRLLRERRWVTIGALLLPIAAGVAALAFTRQVAVTSNVYQPWAELVAILRGKSIPGWVLAWFFTFGPAAMAVIVAAAHPVRAFLAARPHLAFYLLLVGVLAFVGGTDTERILGWAAPVVLVLLGVAIGDRLQVLKRTPALVAVLVVVQLASARVLWPIPVGVDDVPRTAALDVSWRSLAAVFDKVLVVDNYYANLWTYFGSRRVQALMLVFDVCCVVAIVTFLNRRQRLAMSAGTKRR